MGEEKVINETGLRWPEKGLECVRPAKGEVREAIIRIAAREGKKLELVEWEVGSRALGARLRYLTWEDVGEDTLDWRGALPREGAPGGTGGEGGGMENGKLKMENEGEGERGAEEDPETASLGFEKGEW